MRWRWRSGRWTLSCWRCRRSSSCFGCHPCLFLFLVLSSTSNVPCLRLRLRLHLCLCVSLSVDVSVPVSVSVSLCHVLFVLLSVVYSTARFCTRLMSCGNWIVSGIEQWLLSALKCRPTTENSTNKTNVQRIWLLFLLHSSLTHILYSLCGSCYSIFGISIFRISCKSRSCHKFTKVFMPLPDLLKDLILPCKIHLPIFDCSCYLLSLDQSCGTGCDKERGIL